MVSKLISIEKPKVANTVAHFIHGVYLDHSVPQDFFSAR